MGGKNIWKRFSLNLNQRSFYSIKKKKKTGKVKHFILSNISLDLDIEKFWALLYNGDIFQDITIIEMSLVTSVNEPKMADAKMSSKWKPGVSDLK